MAVNCFQRAPVQVKDAYLTHILSLLYIGTRIARLETVAPGAKPRVVVVSGYSEADHESAIADLIARGEARKHDLFVCLMRFGNRPH